LLELRAVVVGTLVSREPAGSRHAARLRHKTQRAARPQIAALHQVVVRGLELLRSQVLDKFLKVGFADLGDAAVPGSMRA
jgi:hypothetical protein